MRSQIYCLCLLVAGAAATPAVQPLVRAGPANPPLRLARHHGRPSAQKRASGSAPRLSLTRFPMPASDDDDDLEDCEDDEPIVTVKTVKVTGTRTKTLDVTATATASRTSTLYSTSTATRTVTKTSSKPSSPPTQSSSTSSKPASSTAVQTTTLSTLQTPIPTSSNYVFTGMATYFYVGLGACGWWSNDGEMVAAVPDHVYDNFPGATPWWNTNGNPVCGNKIDVTWGGNTIRVTVVDRCVGCSTYQIDLSPTAFGSLTNGNLDQGVMYGITWKWV